MKHFYFAVLLLVVNLPLVYAQDIGIGSLRVQTEDATSIAPDFDKSFSVRLHQELVRLTGHTLARIQHIPDTTFGSGLEAMRYASVHNLALIVYGTLTVQGRALYAEVRYVGGESPITLDFTLASDLVSHSDRLARELAVKIVASLEGLIGLKPIPEDGIATRRHYAIASSVLYPLRLQGEYLEATVPLLGIGASFEIELGRPIQSVNSHTSYVLGGGLGYSLTLNTSDFETMIWNTPNIELGGGMVWYLRQFHLSALVQAGLQIHIISRDAMFDDVKLFVATTPYLGTTLRAQYVWDTIQAGVQLRVLGVIAGEWYVQLEPGITVTFLLGDSE